MLLDSIFGAGNFRSEITWRRTSAKGLAFKGYPNNADILLYYTKTDAFTWDRPFRPHDQDYVDKFYRYVEAETGRRYRLDNLSNPNRDRPNLTYEFLGVTEGLAMDKRKNAGSLRKWVSDSETSWLRSSSQAVLGRNERHPCRYDME